MNTPILKVTLLFALIILVAIESCHANRGPGAMMNMLYHRELVQGYGQISIILAVGTLYLQIRRCGFTKQTAGWFGLYLLLFLMNPAWHHFQLGGETERVVGAARNMTILLGLILVTQIFACLRSFWSHETKNTRVIQAEPI